MVRGTNLNVVETPMIVATITQGDQQIVEEVRYRVMRVGKFGQERRLDEVDMYVIYGYVQSEMYLSLCLY